MRKALFLLILFLLPLGWGLLGDPEIIRFLLWFYAPIGIVFSIFVWSRPFREMMFYVTLTPLIMLLVIWAIVLLNRLFDSAWFATNAVGVVWGMFASTICGVLGMFHVLLSYGIYYQFRESGWFEDHKS